MFSPFLFSWSLTLLRFGWHLMDNRRRHISTYRKFLMSGAITPASQARGSDVMARWRTPVRDRAVQFVPGAPQITGFVNAAGIRSIKKKKKSGAKWKNIIKKKDFHGKFSLLFFLTHTVLFSFFFLVFYSLSNFYLVFH